jgi:chromate transporter
MSETGTRLRELIGAFARLGTTAFGGPAVHIAMFEREFVRERQWLTHEHFLDMLAVTNLLPGPNSTEMSIHIGYLRAGVPGALAAGCAFIAPSFFMVWALSWFYVTYGQLPQVAPLLAGIGPVVVAIIAEATWRFGGAVMRTPSGDLTTARGRASLALMALAGVAALLGAHELVVLLAAGAAGIALSAPARVALARWAQRRPPAVLLGLAGWLSPWAAGPQPVNLLELAWFFLRTGSVMFGSGYLLISFIERDLVQTYGWLTERQVLDAIALGQLTPGPLSTTSTFVGYLLGGDAGAIVATVAMFVPAFVVVLLTTPHLERLRQAVVARAFLDGLNPAVVGLLAATVVRLGRGALTDVPFILLGLAAFVLLARWRVNSVWLLLGGAVFGMVKG